MGKYEPLARYLDKLEVDNWDARFSDVERVLGFPLPRSAHEYPAWWANQDGGHSQTKGWREAGWETSKVDLSAKRLRFVRHRPRRGSAPKASGITDTPLAELWEKASAISGIKERDELIKAALTTFIQREAAQALIRLGGSDPHAKAAPRERPWA